ncbi:MAG: PAS domain S-box protein [Pseudomonadota bacterium]
MNRKSIYEGVFDNSHTPMLIIDSATGEIKDGNPAACYYYGYDWDKLLDLNIADINILNQQQIYEEMNRARKEGRKYFKFKHKLSSGAIKDVEVYSGPITVNGEILLFSIIHDVEDKMKMEQKIRLQESYFESLFKNSPEAIAILDGDFRIININESFERIFQYSLDEVRNQNITEIICEEKMYNESAYFKDSINKGEFVRKETLRKRKDGTFINISFLGYPVILNGEQIGIYGIYSDISKIKKEKEEYEEQLKGARIKAEESSRFKSQFIATMTHEIRTPMNGIVGIIDLLEDTGLSDEQKEYFQLLRYSTDRLTSVINDVLDISKIEAGKLELKNVSFNINKLIEELARYFKMQAGRKGLDLDCRVDENIPEFLMGDPEKLTQVLFNLLSNAVKFTEAGHIDICIANEKKDAGKVLINFSIGDTGIGIPKEKTVRVFEDFYQLEPRKNKKNSGTGLGLSIAKKLVDLMGSNISVESEVGKGCTFSFKIEFQISGLQPETTAYPEGGQEISLCGYPSLNILVVEDERINQKIMKSILEKNNCCVTVAENGEEALRILEKRTFDVILMDIYMPEMSGYEAVRLIRKRETLKGRYTPVIAITAAVQEEEKESYMEAGFDGRIAKPAGRDQINSVIARVLKNRNKLSLVCLETLIDRFEGDNELLNEIIDEVLSSGFEKEFLGGLDELIKNGDIEKLNRHIHKLKGSISHFQADSINKILQDMRVCCNNQDLSRAAELLKGLTLEYERLKECLIFYKTSQK